MKLDDNSATYAKLQALYLPFVLKNGKESGHRRQERETNFNVLTRLVSIVKNFLIVHVSTITCNVSPCSAFSNSTSKSMHNSGY